MRPRWRRESCSALRARGLLLHPLPRSQDEVNRATNEAECLAELVLEVAPVGEVQRHVHVGEEREGGRAGLQLGDVVEAPRPAAQGGGLVAGDGALEDAIQLRGAD